MKKKKNRKKKKLHWLFWICFVIVSYLFLSQTMQERNMIKHYNLGNRYYRNGDFDKAQSEYWTAYGSMRKLFVHRDCDVRCNLALSMVASLSPDSVTDENRDDVISELLSARYILTAKECAHKNDDNGHDAECQTLKNEIDDYIEMLNPPEEPEEPEPEEKEKEKDDVQEKESKEEQVRRELEQIQKDGVNDRKDELDTADRLSGFSFYDGICW